MSDHHLADAIAGHVVDGVAICPASIFIDMAYTATTYLWSVEDKDFDNSVASYELAGLSMTNPLVLRENTTAEDLPRVTVEGILDSETRAVTVKFMSRVGASGSPIGHGSCVIQLAQPGASTARDWSRLQPLVQARVRTLEQSSRPREVHAMDRQLFYKIFSEIVDYASPYHGVEEAIIAANFRDAALVFQLPASTDLGNFTCSPFLIDAVVHVAGFLLNADLKKSKSEVHIANHIGSIRVLGDVSSTGPYRVYATVREQDGKAGTSMCDGTEAWRNNCSSPSSNSNQPR